MKQTDMFFKDEKPWVVCYSGGHSSALVAIEAVRKHGKDNVCLLNHNISPKVEHEDIKRFKEEVANYLGIEITYANMEGWEEKTPLDVCRDKSAFKVQKNNALCTYALKTEPFLNWLKTYYPATTGEIRDDVTLLYGFDKDEPDRIIRRNSHMGTLGYKTEFPLAFWERTIDVTEEIGIKRPSTYEIWKHANCIGCLKAKKQHWYLVFCLRPDIWEEAKLAESEIGFSIIKDNFLDELECQFKRMRDKGIIPTEKIKYQTFWAAVKKEIPEEEMRLPCECAI